MNKTEKTFSKSVKNMSTAALGFVAILTGGAVLNKLNSTSAALDKIGKTSTKLGLTAEALQGLHLGAAEAGISTETLDMSVQRMTRRIAEAAKGTGEAVSALNELGLSATELADMTPDEMLKRVADSMLDVTSQSDKVRLSMKLFDSEGVAMVNMLSKGSKGLNDVADKAERLGLIIGSDYIKAIEKSNDAWNISSQIMDTAWKGISVGLSISLEELITNLNNSSTKVDVFSTAMNATKSVIYGLGRGFEIVSTSITTAIGGYDLLYKAMKAFNGEAGRSTAKAEMDAYNEALKTAAMNNQAWAAAMTGTSETALALKAILTTTFEGVNSEKINEDLNKNNKQISEQANLWKLVGKEATIYYNNVSNKTTQAKSLVSAMNTTISSGLTGAFRQAMDGATNFGDMFESILKDVVAQLIQTLFVTQAVSAALSAITGSPTAAGGGGRVQVGGAMADGGIVKSGSSFLVGEGGPEIVSLPKGANVTPHGAAPMGGGTSVNVNVINNAGVDVGVEQDGDNIEIIIDKISNDISRGTGKLGSAFEARYGLKKS